MISLRTLCLALFATSLHAATPTFEWVAGGGGAKSDKTRAVTFDREGNVFMAGETTDDGTFGDQKRTGLGSTDFFLTKLSKDGKFLWVRSLGGSLVDRGYGVATDAAGNAYVTGHYQSTDAQANGQTLPNAGDYDIFIAKYDTKGALIWIKTAGGKGYDYGHGIVVDSKGDIVVTGAVAGEAKFGDVTVNAGSTTRPIFCAKYDAAGNLKWVKTTGGKFSGSGHGLGVDGTDSIYIGGSGGGTGTMDGVALDSKAQAGVVLKLTPAGEAVWAAFLPGVPSAGFHEIAVDTAGRTWCAGMFKGVLNGGPAHSTGDKDNDGVLAHFSPEGKLVWSHVLQGPATDYCLGVATDNTGRCFVTGEFSETATFAGQTLKTQGATDIFTAAFDEKGGLEWLLPTGGAKGDNAYCMAWHPSGRLIFSGACVAPATFGGQTMTSPGGAEAYGAVLLPK
ncbi:SBBP repeat-containing protein [Prosthecobacter fluviatilis]|uniref:SBBP repeat-containing protein n=1 Tax=Prosthecobacter fluviatilis TaxID=445931 RepID=A0ABW0KPJ1_9BACT